MELDIDKLAAVVRQVVREELTGVHARLEALDQGQAALERRVAALEQGYAGLRKEVSDMRSEMRSMQVAIFEFLDGQKRLEAKLDALAELFGRHEVEMKAIKNVFWSLPALERAAAGAK